MERLEQSEYADRILGYHIGFGVAAENVQWGAWYKDTKKRGDYGINAEKAFAEKSGGKYSTIPDTEKLYDRYGSMNEFFRMDKESQILIDYSKFTCDVTVNALNYFSKIVKANTAEKVVGVFYGYIVGSGNSGYNGHLAIDKIINSPYIDFVSSPKGYYKCGPEGPGLEQAPFQSMARKKLWLDEVDNWTYLHPRTDGCRAENFEETRTMLWREFSKNLAQNQGYWWMDLGENTFKDERIMHDFARMTLISKKIRKYEHESQADVLVLIDDNSMHYMTPSRSYQMVFVKEFTSRIKQCGALVDLYRLSDIKDMNIDRYKVIVFLNAFYVDKEMLEAIRVNINKEALLIWNYAAGIMGDDCRSDSVRELTGFSVKDSDSQEDIELYGETKRDFPLISIVDDNEVKPIRLYKNGEIMIGRKKYCGHESILCALPKLEIQEIYDLFTEAGVHTYAPPHCTVYGDNRFLYISASEKVEGSLNLKGNYRLIECMSEKIYDNNIKLKLDRFSSAFYVFSQ